MNGTAAAGKLTAACMHACVRAQGAVTLVTMALPLLYSLVLLVRKESWASGRREALTAAAAQVSGQCYLLEEGHPLSVPLDALAVGVNLPSLLLHFPFPLCALIPVTGPF
jgi:hypothetical protein